MANCDFCGDKINLMSSNEAYLPGVKKDIKIQLCNKCLSEYSIFWSVDYSNINTEMLEVIKNEVLNKPLSDEVKAGVIRQYKRKQNKIQEAILEKQKKQGRERIRQEFLITTGYNFEGYNIVKYLNIAHGEVVLGTGFLSELSSSINDVFGTTSGTMGGKLSKAKLIAQKQLIENAINMGGNAIIGVDFDVNILNNNMIVVSTNGTVVIIRPKQKRQ